MSQSYTTIELSVHDQVASLTLNRPDSRNALNLLMCQELTQACKQLSQDKMVNVVLIEAKGSSFCAGADLKERQTMSTADLVARRIEGFTAYAAIEALPMPVIAVVQGPAFGSGAEIIAACDFVLASDQACVKYPEVGWGTVGATQRLPRIVGRRMAKELLFTGRVVDAQEAHKLSLFNHVYTPENLSTQAHAMAQAIAKCNPLTTRLTKRSIDQGLDTTREGAMGVELLAIQENLQGSDWKSAIAKFGQTASPVKP
jgi:enoyl-CoA hydratase